MSLDQLQPYFGLRDRPFRADVAPSALHRSAATKKPPHGSPTSSTRARSA